MFSSLLCLEEVACVTSCRRKKKTKKKKKRVTITILFTRGLFLRHRTLWTPHTPNDYFTTHRSKKISFRQTSISLHRCIYTQHSMRVHQRGREGVSLSVSSISTKKKQGRTKHKGQPPESHTPLAAATATAIYHYKSYSCPPARTVACISHTNRVGVYEYSLFIFSTCAAEKAFATSMID